MSRVECPDHPGHKILAYQQTAFATPCTLEVDNGHVEIELDDRAEFVRDMETTTIVCYVCSVDGCQWTILPEQLALYADAPLTIVTGVVPGVEQTVPHEADVISGENEEGYDPYGEADAIEDPEFQIDQQEEPIVWSRDLEQEEGETNAEFNQRKAKVTSDALARRKAAVEAKTPLESPLDKFKGVFGGP